MKPFANFLLLCGLLPLPAADNPNIHAGTQDLGSNRTHLAVEDTEAAEIRRQMDLAGYRTGRVTNDVAAAEVARLQNRRRERFAEELQHARDPVAVAVRIVEDPF